uniref:B3-hordein-like n=1 Tax=Crassostrea virginica TaxID=6565 RepID=A0A8B8BDI6_CRAVI|nr:B3-hordein-like [Crassostrea virginica]
MYYPQPTQPIPPPPPQSMPIAPQPQAYQPPPSQWPQQYMYPPYPYTYPVGMPMPMPYPYISHCWGPTPMCYPQMPYMQPIPQMPPQQLQQQVPQMQQPYIHQQPQQLPQQQIPQLQASQQMQLQCQQVPQHIQQQQQTPFQQLQPQQIPLQQPKPLQIQPIQQQPVQHIPEHVQAQPCINSAQQQPHQVRLQSQQQRSADTQTMVAQCIARATVYAGNPVSTMSRETNPLYADHSEQNHDLLGAPSTTLSLKTSAQFPLHDSNYGLINSQNELESHDMVLVSLNFTDQQETGRELVNTTCFASDSVIESAPEVDVNNASEGDRQNGATKVAWGAAIRDFPLMCLVEAFLDASFRLFTPSGLPLENKCWSVPWILII